MPPIVDIYRYLVVVLAADLAKNTNEMLDIASLEDYGITPVSTPIPKRNTPSIVANPSIAQALILNGGKRE